MCEPPPPCRAPSAPNRAATSGLLPRQSRRGAISSLGCFPLLVVRFVFSLKIGRCNHTSMDTCVHRTAIAFRNLVLFYRIGSNFILYSLHAYCGVLFQSTSEEIPSGRNRDDYSCDN